MSTHQDRKKITVPEIIAMKERGEKIAALTAYDYLTAEMLDEAGMDIILVGDSAGMVIAGHETTLPITLEEMIFITRSVRRGVKKALLVADMPFMSYQSSISDGIKNAGRFLKEAKAEAVKLEGGKAVIELVEKLVGYGIPVMGHIGLTPQSINAFGSYKLQGTDSKTAELLRRDAKMLDEAGRGINLFQFGVLDTAVLKRENYVQATGTVTEFSLVTELEYSSLQLLGSAELPPPVSVSNKEANSAKWDGTLITINGVVIDKYSAGGGTTVIISDGNGSTSIRVWDTANLDLSDIVVNKAIIASGVGGVFLSNSIPTYQILSVYPDQIEIDPTYQPSLDDVFLRVDPYPFVPDQGEKIGITYNVGAVNNQATIRIFDLGGRLILTLLSEPTTIIQRRVEWDGRNELRDLVPLGTYICHLEVVEQNSGDKKTAMAPIVVGTILKR